MFTKRSLLLPLMTMFDFADTTLPCAQRNISTVAPQALALLNNEFVHAQSDALAERVVREAGSDNAAQIERAWWLALSRGPTSARARATLAHRRAICACRRTSHGDPPHATSADGKPRRRSARTDPEKSIPTIWPLASLCHVLLNLNEFIYVD